MTANEFIQSLQNELPPTGLSDLAIALWYDGKGDWENAHNIAQSHEGTQAYDRIHAYLHRVEGDIWNADYWYRRANSKRPSVSLKEEWLQLVAIHL